jgi:CRISPR/Cas system CMR-associated protein Cmr5 small subunit
MNNTANYTDLIELFIALFILLVFSFFIISSYFFKKLDRNNSLKNKEEILKNLKNLETKIYEIENITRNLTLRYIDTQEFLAKNESNYKKIFDFLLTEISKIKDFEIENNKLLNIINRKIAKYQKYNKDED